MLIYRHKSLPRPRIKKSGRLRGRVAKLELGFGATAVCARRLALHSLSQRATGLSVGLRQILLVQPLIGMLANSGDDAPLGTLLEDVN
jgi:hypothetical protein